MNIQFEFNTIALLYITTEFDSKSIRKTCMWLTDNFSSPLIIFFLQQRAILQ